MRGDFEIRPGPASFASRRPGEVEELLSQAGGRPGERWQVPAGDGGRLVVRLEVEAGELRAVHVSPEGGPSAEREALALAVRLAERLRWNAIDGAGVAWDAARLKRRLQGRGAALRSALAAVGGLMAVVCGFLWAAQRGLAPAWLRLALLGLLLYAAMRTWGWLERRLARGPAPGAERSGG
jgi:hypothetical protein